MREQKATQGSTPKGQDHYGEDVEEYIWCGDVGHLEQGHSCFWH